MIEDADKQTVRVEVTRAGQVVWEHEGEPQITVTEYGTRFTFPVPVTVEDGDQLSITYDFTRASLMSVCKECGKQFLYHPLGGPIGYDGKQFLRLLCDGTLVKL